MRHGDISDSLFALGAACAADLPGIEYDRKVFKKGVEWQKLPVEKAIRRPWEDDCQVYSFPYTWGSGSLGFGGMGTAAMTTAQVTVVSCGQKSAAVYFGRMLAYVLENYDRAKFYDDIKQWRIADCADATKYGNVHSYGTRYVPRDSI